MPNWSRYVSYTVVGIAGLLLGLLLGWVALLVGWYVGVGLLTIMIAASFTALVLVRRKVPELARPAGIGTTALVVWLVLSWVVPSVYLWLDSSWPYTSASAGRKKVEVDIRQSETVQPIALSGRIATVEYCRAKEKIEEARLQRELDSLLNLRRAGAFTDEDRSREARAFVRLRDIAEERRLCQEQIRKLDGPGDSVLPPKEGSGWGEFQLLGLALRTWFVVLGVLFLIGMVLRAISRPWTQVAGRLAQSSTVLIALFLVAYWLLLGRGWQTIEPSLRSYFQGWTASPTGLLWAAGLALVAIVALVLVIRGRWRHALVLGLLLLLAIPVASWIGGKLPEIPLGFGAAAPKLPPGVVRNFVQLKAGSWTDISGFIVPRTHCWAFGGDYVGTRIKFADGNEDTVGENSSFGKKFPAFLNGMGRERRMYIDLTPVGLYGCGRT